MHDPPPSACPAADPSGRLTPPRKHGPAGRPAPHRGVRRLAEGVGSRWIGEGAIPRGHMHYNVTPKMHMLHHLIEGAEVANPLKLRAYLHESFIGVVAKLYQRTMVGNWRGMRSYTAGPACAHAAAAPMHSDGVEWGSACVRGRLRTGHIMGCGPRPAAQSATPADLRTVQEAALRKYLVGLSLRAEVVG